MREGYVGQASVPNNFVRILEADYESAQFKYLREVDSKIAQQISSQFPFSFELESIESNEPYYIYTYTVANSRTEVRVTIIYDYLSGVMEIISIEGEQEIQVQHNQNNVNLAKVDREIELKIQQQSSGSIPISR